MLVTPPCEIARGLRFGNISQGPYLVPLTGFLKAEISPPPNVKVFDNKIEFYNPGRLPNNITVEDLLSNNYKSTPRNKLIADFFKSLGFIEKYGSGIRRIVDYFKAENLPVPEFRNISDGFMVTTYGKEEDVPKDVPKDVLKDVLKDDRRKHLLSLIAENKWITMSELAKKCNVNIKTIKRDIDLLKSENRLLRVGGRKSGYWEIN